MVGVTVVMEAAEAEIERLNRALVVAEAALADIGDADRNPGDDVAWLESRAAEVLPSIRAVIDKIGIISAEPTQTPLTDAQIDRIWHALPVVEIHNKAASEGVSTNYAERTAFARAILAQASGQGVDTLQWAVSKWHDEVANRPLVNIHRRTLDGTWRQVIRRAGGNPDELIGHSHDALVALTKDAK